MFRPSPTPKFFFLYPAQGGVSVFILASSTTLMNVRGPWIAVGTQTAVSQMLHQSDQFCSHTQLMVTQKICNQTTHHVIHGPDNRLPNVTGWCRRLWRPYDDGLWLWPVVLVICLRRETAEQGLQPRPPAWAARRRLPLRHCIRPLGLLTCCDLQCSSGKLIDCCITFQLLADHAGSLSESYKSNKVAASPAL